MGGKFGHQIEMK